MVKIASAAIAKECNVHKGSRVVPLGSFHLGAGGSQFMLVLLSGAFVRLAVREFEKRRFPMRFTFGTAASQS